MDDDIGWRELDSIAVWIFIVAHGDNVVIAMLHHPHVAAIRSRTLTREGGTPPICGAKPVTGDFEGGVEASLPFGHNIAQPW